MQCSFIETIFLHVSFPVNLLHIRRTPLLKNIPQRMLLLFDTNQEESVNNNNNNNNNNNCYYYYYYYYYLNQFLNLPQISPAGPVKSISI